MHLSCLKLFCDILRDKELHRPHSGREWMKECWFLLQEICSKAEGVWMSAVAHILAAVTGCSWVWALFSYRLPLVMGETFIPLLPCWSVSEMISTVNYSVVNDLAMPQIPPVSILVGRVEAPLITVSGGIVNILGQGEASFLIQKKADKLRKGIRQ